MLTVKHFTVSCPGIDRALREVEEGLTKIIGNGLPQQLVAHLLPIGGKFNRTRLVLYFAGLKGEIDPVAIKTAVGIELLHWASLVHDDIVDGASIRRGKASCNKKFGYKAALLLGDWLFAQAYRHFTAVGAYHVNMMNRVLHLMTSAELEAACRPTEIFSDSTHHYLRQVYKKTAVFLEACCMLGAKSAEIRSSLRLSAGRFGFWLGTAYQIRDDIHDTLYPELQVNGEISGRPQKQPGLPSVLLRQIRPGSIRLSYERWRESLIEQGIIQTCLELYRRCLIRAGEYLGVFDTGITYGLLEEFLENANRYDPFAVENQESGWN